MKKLEGTRCGGSLGRGALAVVVAASLGWGCGKKSEPGPAVTADQATDAAVAAQDGTDLSDVMTMGGPAAIGVGAPAQIPLSPEGLLPLAASVGQEDVLRMLPPPLLRAPGLLEAVEAPFQMAAHFIRIYAAQPSAACSAGSLDVRVTSGVCPVRYAATDLKAAGSCSGIATFTQCATTAVVGDRTITVVVNGPITFTLTRTPATLTTLSAQDALTLSSTPGYSITATGPDGTTRSVAYQGDVGGTLTLDFQINPFQIVSAGLQISTTNGLTITGDGGRVVVVQPAATRTVTLTFGQSIEINNVGDLNLTLPDGTTHAAILNPVWKKVSGAPASATKVLEFNDLVTVDGKTRSRQGTLTLTVDRNDASGNVLQVTLDGTARYQNPSGVATTLTYKALLLDHACPQRPRGGSLVVARGDRSAVITFDHNCDCNATVTFDDGSTKTLDLCRYRELHP